MYFTPTGGAVLPEPSRAMREFATASKGHFTGQLTVGIGSGQLIHLESHLEMQAALVLVMRKEFVEIEEQVAFEWWGEDGNPRTHYFDFRVTSKVGTRAAIAVKPSRRLNKKNFLAEMVLIAGQMTSSFADDVRVVTEQHLDPVDLYNAELLYGVRAADVEADQAAEKAVSSLLGAVSLEQLTQSIGLGARGFRALLRLIAAQRVLPALGERITKNTLIYPARAN